MSDFGVIIATHHTDYGYAKAAVASVRHYMGDVPICLIINGDFSTDDMKRAYGVQTLYRADVKDAYLREHSFGWGVTKMVAFFEGPFERFLFIDADTIMLGDLRQRLLHGPMGDHWDFFIDRPRYEFDANAVEAWFFNPEKMDKRFAGFHWRNYTRRLFCTGVWAARRGAISLEEYKELQHIQNTEPGLFYMADMGILNFMIFRAEYEGRAKVAADEIQIIAPDFTLGELTRRWQIDRPPAKIDPADAAVLHYTELKPSMSLGPLAEPMTYFRREAARASGKGKLATYLTMRREDIHVDIRKLKRTKAANLARRLLKGPPPPRRVTQPATENAR